MAEKKKKNIKMKAVDKDGCPKVLTSRDYLSSMFVVRLDDKMRIQIPAELRRELVIDQDQPFRVWATSGKGIFLEMVQPTEIEDFLNDFKLTVHEMDAIWKTLTTHSEVIMQDHKKGYDWKDMTYNKLVACIRKYRGLIEENKAIAELYGMTLEEFMMEHNEGEGNKDEN